MNDPRIEIAARAMCIEHWSETDAAWDGLIDDDKSYWFGLACAAIKSLDAARDDEGCRMREVAMTHTDPRIEIIARALHDKIAQIGGNEWNDPDVQETYRDHARPVLRALDAARPEVEAARQAVIEAARGIVHCTEECPWEEGTLTAAVRAMEKLEAEHDPGPWRRER